MAGGGGNNAGGLVGQYATGQPGTSGAQGATGSAPWWQGGNTPNLTKNAPTGYKYDPVQQKYVRTPQSVGQDAGAALQGLEGSLGGTSYGAVPGPATPNIAAPVPVSVTAAPVLQSVNNQPANAAAFAQAKDQVGLQMRGALTGLSGAMAGRGIAGSGLEAAGDVGVVNSGQQQLGDVSRQQAVTNANLSNANAVTAYQGGLTQRGQDIGAAEANLNATTGVNEANQNSLNTQRQQNIAAAEAQQARLAQILQGLGY